MCPAIRPTLVESVTTDHTAFKRNSPTVRSSQRPYDKVVRKTSPHVRNVATNPNVAAAVTVFWVGRTLGQGGH